MDEVVVTGLGVISPLGNDINTFFENALNGMSGITNYDGALELKLNSRVVGNVQNFQREEEQLTNEEIEKCGSPAKFALCATMQALKDASITQIDEKDRTRTGICISTAIADSPYCEKQFMEVLPFFKGDSTDIDQNINKDFFTLGSFSDVTSCIAKKYDIRGEVLTMSTGCVGGLDAIGYAYYLISQGYMDMMICGASEAPITGLTFSSFDIIGAISKRNVPPTEASAPFDANRDGFVLSEAAGIVILESKKHAKQRKAKMYARILSYETSNNAYHMTALPSDGKPLAALIELALERAGVSAKKIDFINAHGSSTPQNDIFETAAYKAVFGTRAKEIPISANKSMMGHPLGAASAVEFVRSCLSMKYSKIPPTINLKMQDELCDLDYVPNHYRDCKINYMITDASGFSGIHSCIVLKKEGGE